jgi:ATP-dependent RNA helicase DeaD
MKNQFEIYDLSSEVIEALTLLNYTIPTPIQEQVIPHLRKGRDVVGKSQTGSGKTAAFAIPICEGVVWGENAPQALVLEPTRELAVQVSDEIFHIGRKKRLKVPAVFGGFPIDKQALTLKQKSHVVVGTPGRVYDHLRRGTLVLDKVKYLVIDEADLMLDMGFLDDVKAIIGFMRRKPITSLFSATMGSSVRRLVEEYMNAPVEIEIEAETETAEQITEVGYRVENDDKFQALLQILIKENPDYCMIFCATRDMVNVLCRQMKRKRIRCGMLHGLVEQKERLRTLDEFREKQFRYLITTDVAARGIDFENITHVINYDFPTGKESYVHRIGRTGRNGRTGKAISFIQLSEIRMMSMVEEYTSSRIAMNGLPDNSEEETKIFYKRQQEKFVRKERKGAVFNKNITKICISGGRKSKMRAGDIVGTLCNIEGMTDKDIGIIDIRDSLTYVEILNGKGRQVMEVLPKMTIKGKIRKIKSRR